MGPRDSSNNYGVSTRKASSSSLGDDGGLQEDTMTILGFGSLLSEKSVRACFAGVPFCCFVNAQPLSYFYPRMLYVQSRLTFPDLKNFRLGKVPNYRRVFGHPTGLFFRRGIANLETLEMSSLAVEPSSGHSLLVSVFEVSAKDMMEGGIPSQAFLEREEEFDIVEAPYIELECDGVNVGATDDSATKKGIICTRSSDETYLEKWGNERFNDHFRKYGIETIWGWKEDSGLRPCAIYLRHCYLAAKSMGNDCFESFLDETFLVDRKTTIRQYLEKYPHILDLQPPPDLVSRYSG